LFDPTIIIFLSSGLFLGWSLGANDAANVFGTAVGSRMVHFTTAAIICGIFVILGAFISGTGASQTLGKLGSVNAIGGSFMAALSAGLTVSWMTKLGLPVSTSQTIIGSIVGWNLFSDSYTDISSLLTILSTWIICPLLSAFIAALLFLMTKLVLKRIGIGLIRFDGYTRLALILAGADIVKIGIGPGSVCTTRTVTGVGYPQLSAIIECADAAHGLRGHVISDGGCSTPGDVSKAFGAGADFVMLGGMLAGHEESGGKVIERDGKKYKEFYGMSSDTAMERYYGDIKEYRASEGEAISLEYRGPIDKTIQQILGGIRSAATYIGAKDLKNIPKCISFVLKYK